MSGHAKHRISYTSFSALADRWQTQIYVSTMAAYTNTLYSARTVVHSGAQHGGTACHDRATCSRTEILQAIRLSYLSLGEIGDVCFACSTFFFLPSPSPVLHFSIFFSLFFFTLLDLFIFPFPFFFFFLFSASVPRVTINNLSKAVNREIDRRSSRKLLPRCIRLKVLFIRVSRNLFVRGACFEPHNAVPFDTRGNPAEEIEQIS